MRIIILNVDTYWLMWPVDVLLGYFNFNYEISKDIMYHVNAHNLGFFLCYFNNYSGEKWSYKKKLHFNSQIIKIAEASISSSMKGCSHICHLAGWLLLSVFARRSERAKPPSHWARRWFPNTRTCATTAPRSRRSPPRCSMRSCLMMAPSPTIPTLRI